MEDGKRTMRKGMLSAVCFAVLAFCAVYWGWFGGVDKTAGDILYHHPDGVDDRIKIIRIDEKTMNAFGEYDSWNRGMYAELLEKLWVSEQVHPAVVGFDVLFSADNQDEADERFAKACKKAGNIVTSFSFVFERKAVEAEDGELKVSNLYVSDVVLPYPALGKVTTKGFANALQDEDDGVIRNTFLYLIQDGQKEYSFNASVYNAYARQCGFEPVYPDKNIISFRYSGKSGDYEGVSLIDVLEGRVPAEAFNDCIVLVGAYAAGMMDAYRVPVERGQQMYGVEIHANIIQALLEGKYLNKVPVLLSAVIVSLLSGALAFVCSKTSVVKIILFCFGSAVIKLISGNLLFRMGYCVEVLAFPVVCGCILIYETAVHYYIASRSRKQIERAFEKYVAPQVVRKIARSGKYELKLGGELREVAVLFVDIRGFTPLSESLKPEQVVEILNSYLNLTTDCIFRHGGMLDKFVGDATMAVFNAPFDEEDYIYKAVLTAWDIVQGSGAINQEALRKFGKSVGFGVGVHCGSAVVGNIGCEFRMDYTAIGDTVNTAARLEANCPSGQVYISREVYEQVKERIEVEEVGEIPLKGKSVGVFVYSVTGIQGYQGKMDKDGDVK